MSTCVKCQLINCTNPADIAIYSLQDALFFNGVPLTFVVNCPEGQVCQPGVYPKTVTYPPGTFVVPNPPPCSGFPIVMTVQGCKGPVTRTLPCPSSNGAIQAAANEIIMELGQQQAECDSEEENPPAPPPPQYANEEVYYTVDCEEGETLTYSGPPLPPYITLDVDNGRLIFAPNTVYGVTQAAANATAQSILNGIGDDAITAGVLTCEPPEYGCSIFESLVWGEPVYDITSGSATVEASANTFSGHATVPAVFGFGAKGTIIGTLVYTGEELECCVDVSFESGGEAPGCCKGGVVVTVRQDGVILAQGEGGCAGNSFPMPFTLSAGVGSTVEIEVSVHANACETFGSSITMSGQIGTC
jgi:hypothetical protein